MPNIPSRELYWHIEGHWLIYPLFLVAMAVFLYGCYRKYNLYKNVKQENRLDQWPRRLWSMLVNTFCHARLLRDTYPGIMHLTIFWGFFILVVGTIIVALQADLGLQVLFGNFYLGFSLVLDLFGLALLVGLLMAVWRRYVTRPERLDNQADDLLALILLLAIVISGFLLEGLRIAGTADPWAAWSPIGQVIARAFSADGMISIYPVVWWLHFILTLGLIAYIPYAKLWHIMAVPANQFMRSLQPVGTISTIDFEDETCEVYGLNKLGDLTWKQLFDTDACVRCGRCQDNCPAHLTGKSLSPKKVTQALKNHWLEQNSVNQQKVVESGAEKEVAAAVEEVCVPNGVISEEAIWACTNCRSCEEQCPVFIEQVPRMVELRRSLVLMESSFPAEAQLAFRNMENNSNPWGIGWAKRAEWASDLDVPVLGEMEKKPEYLLWVGCAGSFDKRYQKVARVMVNVLRNAGVDFAILGTEEKCCGDSARRLGNEYLYQSLAQENIETITGYGVKKIITTCPHCFNTLAKDYGQMGAEFEVIHHAEFLGRLVREKRLQLSKSVDLSVTYHGSCFLGRYNEIYNDPREVLKAIPGIKLKEMARNRQKSFCCGAGGGRMWLEEKEGTRINVNRTEQALELNPDVIGIACPFCMTMLGDGVKAKDAEEKVKVLDIVELVEKAL